MRLLVVLSAAAASRAISPPPPGMSTYQAQYMAGVQKVAEAASAAATPHVLAALADPTFRDGLANCCPSVADLNGEQLLTKYRELTRIAEMVRTRWDSSCPFDHTLQ